MNQTKIEKKDSNTNLDYYRYETRDYDCNIGDKIKDSYGNSFYIITEVKSTEEKEKMYVDKTIIIKPENTIMNSIETIENMEDKDTTIEGQNETNQRKEITQKSEEEFKEELRTILYHSKLEIGEVSEFEEYVSQKIETNRDMLLKAIMELYLEYADREEIIIKILEALGELEYDKINPQGTLLALNSIHHIKAGVAQTAMRALGRWKNEEFINALESVRTEEKWIQRYRDKIIKVIKESGKNANISKSD